LARPGQPGTGAPVPPEAPYTLVIPAAANAPPGAPPGGPAKGKKWGSRSHWPALLARFPRVFWRPAVDDRWPDDPWVVRRKHLTEYGELKPDLSVWLDQVEPRFRRLDHRARILQNQFWRQHVALIVGGLVATTLGVVQAAVGAGVVGLAVAQAVLAGGMAGLTVLIRSRRAQQRFLTARLSAERVKSEFFLFLARAGDYDMADPAAALLQRVDDIETAEAVR
jgi:hypothetical protein